MREWHPGDNDDMKDDNKVLYGHIKEYLLGLIESGRLPEGAKLPSEHELAARFHVNRNWPRRVLHDLAVEGYVARSQGCRSVVAPPSGRRQAFCIGKGPTLGIVLPRYLNPFEREIADGFMRYAAWQEVNSMIYTVRFDEAEESAFLLKAPETGIAGLAIWLRHDTPMVASALNTLSQRRFPVVQVDRYVRGTEWDFVVTDNETMLYELTVRMIQRGHRKFAFISVPNDVSSTRDRFAGFKRALAEHCLSFSKDCLGEVNPDETGAVHCAVMQIIKRRHPPSAFLCVNGALAAVVLQELDRLHLRVPQQIDLAFVDDMSLAAGLDSPLLHACQPGQEIGRSAAEQLLARLYDPDLPVMRRFLSASVEERP